MYSKIASKNQTPFRIECSRATTTPLNLPERRQSRDCPVNLPDMLITKLYWFIQVKNGVHIVLNLQEIGVDNIHMLSVYFSGGFPRTTQTATQTGRHQAQNAETTNKAKTI